jgi:predicted small secreted protein
MKRPRLLPFAATAAALVLTACEARFGNDVQPSGNGSAENKAEEGEVSINAPGVQMKIDIPEGLRHEAGIHDDNGLIYPGSTMSGMHVEGGREGGQGKSEGEVELRFASTDGPDRVAHWYQDPARAGDFTIASATRDGAAYVFAGTRKEGDGRFRIRLAPGQSGGTDGRVLLSDSD